MESLSLVINGSKGLDFEPSGTEEKIRDVG